MRRSDWASSLSEYITAKRGEPHAFGKNDCLLFCAGAVQALTGDDFGAEHRGKYRSESGSVRYLRSLGFDSPEALIDSLLTEKPLGFAQRGDIVLDCEGTPGVVVGKDAVCIAHNRDGFVRIPRAEWRKAWEV